MDAGCFNLYEAGIVEASVQVGQCVEIKVDDGRITEARVRPGYSCDEPSS